MRPSARVLEILRQTGPKGIYTSAALHEALADAHRTPEELRLSLETVDAYGSRRAALERARAVLAQRHESVLPSLRDAIEAWGHRNRSCFAPHADAQPPGGWWGRWNIESGHLEVRAARFRRLMNSWGFGVQMAARRLEAEGHLRVVGRSRCIVVRMTPNVVCRCYAVACRQMAPVQPALMTSGQLRWIGNSVNVASIFDRADTDAGTEIGELRIGNGGSKAGPAGDPAP